MIKHVALFNLKPEATGRTMEENKQQIIRNARRLRDEIPVNKRVEVAEQIARDRDAPWAADLTVLVEFETLDDYDTYFNHPVHQEAARFAALVSEHVEGMTFESPSRSSGEPIHNELICSIRLPGSEYARVSDGQGNVMFAQ